MTEISESSPPRLLNTRYGNLSVPAGTNDLITSFLEQYGEWAGLEVEYLAALLPPKARILDVGAYVGTFALGLAQAANAAFVAMVEGNPAIAPHLTINATLNLHCSHEVINALVVNSAALPVETGWADADNAGSASFANGASGAVRVPLPDTTIGFKALVERFGPLDLVKLDVEGMEAQLLADHPLLLQDRSVLLWLECNENPASLALAQVLLDTGRPITYFAWPSHNPENYQGVARKIFPFAYEAGLMLGAETTPLTPQQRRAGCLVKSIHTVEDLREALWLTPRWAPREWDVLDRTEIAAIATHLWLGKKRESFLSEVGPAIGGSAKEGAAIQASTNPDSDGRLLALKDARIAQLESGLAERVSRELEMERMQGLPDANDQLVRELIDKLDVQHALHQELVALNNELWVDKVSAQRASHQEQVAAMLEQVRIVSSALHGIRSSLTWRIASRLSRIVGRIPVLKRMVRRLLRHKMVGAPS